MVPNGWKIKPLGDLAIAVTSGSRDWAQYYADSGSKFIRMTNLSRDSINLKLDDLKYVDVKSDSSDGKRTSLQAGDILISITAELGKIGWVPDGLGEAYINQHTALVRLHPNHADSKFIAYLLSSTSMNGVINGLNDAGAKAGLNLPTIKNLTLKIPPIPEQRKIAQILSIWDKAITTTERLLTNRQQHKKALMQRLLTGKQRFAGFEGEWKYFRFEDILNIEIGGTPSRSKPEYWDDKKLTNNRWLSIANLQGSHIYDTTEYISDLGVKNSNVTLIPAGTIVMSFKLTIGRRAVLMNSCYTNEAICAFFIKDKAIVNNDFLYQVIGIVDFDAEIDQAVKGKTLNKEKLKRLQLRLPPYVEQQKIASVLSAADAEITTIQNQLDNLKQQKKALMQQLLTGKRRVKVDSPALAAQ